jgi:cobalt-zinc-cadmium efflux system outer membrane protein
MKILRVFVVSAACSSLALGQTPQTHPWTLHEALQYFRAKSPAMAAARAQLDAVRANEVTAALRVNPILNSANEDFRAFTPSQSDIAHTQEFTDSLAWTFERGGKRSARIQSARLGTTVAQDNLRDTQRQLEFQLKSAFVNVVLAKAVLKLAQDNLADYQRTLEANALRLQAGDISQTDFDRIKVQEAQFQSDLLNAQMSLLSTRVQLESMLGLPDSPRFDIDGSLDAPAITADEADLLTKALANRPDYLAAVDGVRKAEADLQLAKAYGATDVVVAPEYKRNGPDNTLGVSLQVPLRIFDRNQGEKLRTQHVLESSRFSEVVARLQTTADVTQALESYRTSKALSQLYTSDYLDRAHNVRDRMEFSYQHGAVNLLDYLDAIRSYRDVELASLNARAQLLLAIHQMSFATATELLP